MKLNRKHFAELFRSDYYTVQVHFCGTSIHSGSEKAYTYKVHKDVEVQLTDRLVVCVPNQLDAVQELKVVRVVSINHEPGIEEDVGLQYKWIVGKLDDIISGYKVNIEKDQKLKRAVAKLEGAMERAMLRVQLSDALKELAPEERESLAEELGIDISSFKKLT